jgi:hypothetical protein
VTRGSSLTAATCFTPAAIRAAKCAPCAGPGEAPRPAAAPRPLSTRRPSSRSNPGGASVPRAFAIRNHRVLGSGSFRDCRSGSILGWSIQRLFEVARSPAAWPLRIWPSLYLPPPPRWGRAGVGVILLAAPRENYRRDHAINILPNVAATDLHHGHPSMVEAKNPFDPTFCRSMARGEAKGIVIRRREVSNGATALMSVTRRLDRASWTPGSLYARRFRAAARSEC